MANLTFSGVNPQYLLQTVAARHLRVKHVSLKLSSVPHTVQCGYKWSVKPGMIKESERVLSKSSCIVFDEDDIFSKKLHRASSLRRWYLILQFLLDKRSIFDADSTQMQMQLQMMQLNLIRDFLLFLQSMVMRGPKTEKMMTRRKKQYSSPVHSSY